MSWSRRLTIALLATALVMPSGAAVAQDETFDGWVTSVDGLAHATNDTFDAPPGWSIVRPGDFPPTIAELPGPDRLYATDRTLETGTRTVRSHTTDDYAWLDQGRTPVLATAVATDEDVTWARRQHIVSTPTGCLDADGPTEPCAQADLIGHLLALNAPVGSPVPPPPAADDFRSGSFASTASIERDGTLFSFGGGATVGTRVRVRDDDTIVVRGEANIGDALGGRLRGYDAVVIDTPPGWTAPSSPFGWGELPERAGEVKNAGAKPTATNRRVLDCPPSGQGYVVSQFLVSGAGRTIGPTLDPGLEGGVSVLISEVVPVDCGRLSNRARPNRALPQAGPEETPAATLVCGSTRAWHRLFRSTQDGRQVTSVSSLAQRWAMVTFGIVPGAAAFAAARVGGANGGDLFTIGLEGVQLESAAGSEIVLWLGESEVGIDAYGPKRYRDLELTVDGVTFDLVEQQRDLFGSAFDVGPSQEPSTNCPGFEFTFEDLETIFPDGFESGDVSAWSYSRAD